LDIESYISSGIIEQYVMGLCTAEEKNELELLRQTNPLLDKSIADFEVELERRMMASAYLPGIKTDDAVLESLRVLGTPVVQMQPVVKNVKRLSWVKMLAAASVLLFGVSAFFNYTQYKQNKEQAALLASKSSVIESLPVANYNILKDPSITPIAMMGVGLHTTCRCTMFWDKKTGKAYIMIHHLSLSGDAKDYQLWATVNGKPVSVGMVDDKIRGQFIEITGVPEGANQFAVTLENAGGATTPTVDNTFLVGKI
jgi:anti-sigma-K factor RskA